MLVLFAPVLSLSSTLHAQGRITSPKEQFGFNIGDDYVLVNYTKNSIERGNRNSWTTSPHRLEAIEAAANAERRQTANGQRGGGGQRGGNLTGEAAKKYWDMLHDPKARD